MKMHHFAPYLRFVGFSCALARRFSVNAAVLLGWLIDRVPEEDPDIEIEATIEAITRATTLSKKEIAAAREKLGKVLEFRHDRLAHRTFLKLNDAELRKALGVQLVEYSDQLGDSLGLQKGTPRSDKRQLPGVTKGDSGESQKVTPSLVACASESEEEDSEKKTRKDPLYPPPADGQGVSSGWEGGPSSENTAEPDDDEPGELPISKASLQAPPPGGRGAPLPAKATGRPVAVLPATSSLPAPQTGCNGRHKHADGALVVLSHLNLRAGREFRPVESHLKLIRCRLEEVKGDVEGVKLMIDRQTAKWKTDAKMWEYLRPATLFQAGKFHCYYDDRSAPLVAAEVKRPPTRFEIENHPDFLDPETRRGVESGLRRDRSQLRSITPSQRASLEVGIAELEERLERHNAVVAQIGKPKSA